MPVCPVCGESTSELNINAHLDKGCPKSSEQLKPQPRNQWSFLRDKSQSAKALLPQSKENAPKIVEGGPKVHEKEELYVNSGGFTQTSDSSQSSQAGSNSTRPQNSAPLSKKVKKTVEELAPLAEQMRPSALDEYVGQVHLMGPQGVLRRILGSPNPRIPSMVLWGPSGVGKTTLARVIATQVSYKFIELSATTAGANDVKKVMLDAQKEWQLLRRRTILFLDEIHRFSRTQQDSLLPGVERGDIVLIGATTENPSFKLGGALLSRMRVFVLQKLTEEELRTVVKRAVSKYEDTAELNPETLSVIVNAASATGDARQALNMLETVRALPQDADPRLVLKHTLVHDQRGENHYDLISALHKSIRGGDADAALYYLARMLCGGEDPLYISRRLMRIASEDIGLADDSCLPFAVAVHTTVQQVGMPECDAMLAHAAVKFARAPKSVEVYKALGLVSSEINNVPEIAGAPVPFHIRNAPTKLMAEVGYGANYKYNPAFKGIVKQTYLPNELGDKKWLGVWQPTEEDES